MTTQAQILQQRRTTIVREAQRRNYPPTLTQQELYTKITAACTEVGIDDITIREWQKFTYGTGITDGVIREKKYNYPHVLDQRTNRDIAYIIDESKHPKGTYNCDMIHVNWDIFGEAKAQQFDQALRSQGLIPDYYPSTENAPLQVNEEGHPSLSVRSIEYAQALRERNVLYK